MNKWVCIVGKCEDYAGTPPTIIRENTMAYNLEECCWVIMKITSIVVVPINCTSLIK
ncbi:MAG: hypothetical protein ACTSYU_03010 [Promethearchaeota archaeon]